MPSKHHDEGLYRSHLHRKQLFIRDLGVACGQSKTLNVRSFHGGRDEYAHKKYHTAPCTRINMSDPSSITHHHMGHRSSDTSHHGHHGGHSQDSIHRENSHHSIHGEHSHHNLHRGDSDHHRGGCHQISPKGSNGSHHSLHQGHSHHSHHGGHSDHRHRGLCSTGCPPPPIPPTPPTPPGCPPVSRYGRPQQAAICIIDDDYKVEPVSHDKIRHHESHHSDDPHKWLRCSLDWAEDTLHESNREIITGPKKQMSSHKHEQPHCTKDNPKPFCKPCHPPELFRVQKGDDRHKIIDCRKVGPEIRGGKFYSGCICHKRNGLQDDCPLTICQGKGCNEPPCAKIRPRTFCEPPYATDITTAEEQKRLQNLVNCGCKEFIESKTPKEHYHRAGYPCPICDASPKPTEEESTWTPEKKMCIYRDKPEHRAELPCEKCQEEHHKKRNGL